MSLLCSLLILTLAVVPAHGLALTVLRPARSVAGTYHPAETTLRVSRSFASAFGGESGTLTCSSIPFFRAWHGSHARFWQPREHAYGDAAASAGLALSWFNTREHALGDIFHHLLAAPAAAGALVVDVGSNVGWYSMYATGRGHPVLAVDMQAECTRRCRCASIVNRVTHLLALHSAYVSDDAQALPLPSNTKHCLGSVNPAWRSRYAWHAHVDMVQPFPLGREVLRAAAAADGQPRGAGRVVLLKADVEGGEVAVVRSLAQDGALSLVDNILAEYSPHLWGDLNVSIAEGVLAFAPLFAEGLSAADVPENAELLDPAAWARAPTSGPAGFLPRGRITDVAALGRYTNALLAEVAKNGDNKIYTLWFTRV